MMQLGIQPIQSGLTEQSELSQTRLNSQLLQWEILGTFDISLQRVKFVKDYLMDATLLEIWNVNRLATTISAELETLAPVNSGEHTVWPLWIVPYPHVGHFVRSIRIYHRTLNSHTKFTLLKHQVQPTASLIEILTTGEKRALKIFASTFQVDQQYKRELEALKNLQHENIVHFYGEETEITTRQYVVVMEYCEGGTLSSLLSEPENLNGLQEDELLLVMKHLASGLRHLREKGFLHRDIKPGNILRGIADDGKSVFKLSDFGTTRQLSENDLFPSLVGTEEYLHPDIYKAAFIEKPDGIKFDFSSDIWSISATLYHTATGNLPFRPFGGCRNNRQDMYRMIASKPKDAISGVQRDARGPIEYCNEFPQSCKLSDGLKKLLVPMIAALFDREEKWNFERLFNEIDNISNRKIIHYFDACTLSPDRRLYLGPKACFENMQLEIERQTTIKPREQILVHKHHVLDRSQALPNTSPSSPMIMVFGEPLGSKVLQETMMSTFSASAESMPKFPEIATRRFNYDEDYNLTKKLIAKIHHLRSIVRLKSLVESLLLKTMISFDKDILHSLENLLVKLNMQYTRFDDYLTILGQTTLDISLVSNDFAHVGEKPLQPDSMDPLKTIRHRLELVTPEIEKQMDDVKDSIMKEESITDTCVEKRCQPKFDRILVKIRCIAQSFAARRTKRSISSSEENLHKFERKEIESLCDKAKRLYDDHCRISINTMIKEFVVWHVGYLENKKKVAEIQCSIEIIEKSISEFIRPAPVNVSRSFSLEQSKRRALAESLTTELDKLEDVSHKMTSEEIEELKKQMEHMTEITTSLQEPESLGGILEEPETLKEH